MMKKRGIIGIGITVLVLSVIVGIASLPDEVLIESSAIENSKIVSEDIQNVPAMDEISDLIAESVSEKNTDITNAELNSLKMELDQLKKELNHLKTTSMIPEEISEISEIEDEELEEQSEGRVFVVELNSGIGAGQK